MPICSIENCQLPVKARGLCNTHYMRWYVEGTILPPATTLRRIDPVDLGWLAGIIEGEGTFVATTRRTGRAYPVVAVQMTDRDVIVRLQSIAGIGNVNEMSVRGLMTKPTYTWRVTRSIDVVAVCAAIRPLLGIRRTAQMSKMLERTNLVDATFPRARRTYPKIEVNL